MVLAVRTQVADRCLRTKGRNFIGVPWRYLPDLTTEPRQVIEPAFPNRRLGASHLPVLAARMIDAEVPDPLFTALTRRLLYFGSTDVPDPE